jgi:hypothetical protein
MSTRPKPRRLAVGATALTALAALVAAPSPTSSAAVPHESSAAATSASGTITYVLRNNVWVAHQDGTGARQVTTNGTAAIPWRSPTSSDNGHIVAGRGPLIYRMDQWGHVFNVIDPPDLQDSAGQYLTGGPAHLAVSPDESWIAYTYEKYSCPINLACKMRYVTAFTRSTALSDWRASGVTYFDNPSWITSSRVAVNDDLIDNIKLFDLSRGDTYWFDEDDYTNDDKPLFDFEVSRRAPYGVAIRGKADEAQLYLYRLSGNYVNGGRPPIPEPLCSTEPVLGITSPTWSADGGHVAWPEPDGLWIVPIGDEPCAAQPALAVPGARTPSYSAAALQTTRPHYPQSTPASFRVASKPRITGRALTGRRLRASAGTFAPRPSAVAWQWLRDGKVVRGATKPAYRVTRKDRRHRLTVRVTVRRAGYRPLVVISAPVRVRR